MSDPKPSNDRQSDHLDEVPRDELVTLAQELGLAFDPRADKQELADVIRQRRRLLEQLDRQAILELVAWGRRPVRPSAGKEELAREIALIRKADFGELSQPALYVLAMLRSIPVTPDDDKDSLAQALRSHESLFNKLHRARRKIVGKLISRLAGQEDKYKFLPEGKRPPSLAEQVEEHGLVGGLAKSLRGAADDYVAAKLDEIEVRIDRKLDDIDRRLAEWRDKEIANRLRIIKITLWASIIVAILSVAYAWMVKHFFS